MIIEKHKLDSFYVLTEFEAHACLRQSVLSCIDKIEPVDFSSVDSYYGDSVYKLDWDNAFDKNRDWDRIIRPQLEKHLQIIAKSVGYQSALINQLWFQQYRNGNTHGWHTHGNNFTGVYYLELPENSPKTELVNCFNQKEIITPDTREGNILIFPSFVIHRAPILKTECRKTIISFNIDFENISIDVLNNLI